MKINKALIQSLHDSYQEEYESKIHTAQVILKKSGPLDLNYRLVFGECLQTRRVLNDMKYILGLELIEESPFGIMFNEE